MSFWELRRVSVPSLFQSSEFEVEKLYITRVAASRDEWALEWAAARKNGIYRSVRATATPSPMVPGGDGIINVVANATANANAGAQAKPLSLQPGQAVQA